MLLERAANLLAGREHGRPYEGVAEGALVPDAQSRPFVDFGPLAGAMNPIAPPLQLEWSPNTVVARVRFGATEVVGEATLVITDLAGRRVWGRMLTGGAPVVEWDGRGLHGLLPGQSNRCVGTMSCGRHPFRRGCSATHMPSAWPPRERGSSRNLVWMW